MENRQAAIRPAPGYWRNPFTGDGAPLYTKGDGTVYKKDAEKTGPAAFDFLNAQFKAYPLSKSSIKYSEENYYFLYDSAKNYAGLINKDFTLEPDGYNFTKLFRYFNSLLPEGQYCELYYQSDTIYFHVIDDRNDGVLHYIPCKVIDSAEGELKELYTVFFSIFQNSQRLVSLKNDYIYDVYKSDIKYSNITDGDFIQLFKEYEEGGTGKLLDKIKQEPGMGITRLKNRLTKINPRDSKQAGIISLMLEGLEIFRMKKSISDFSFFPYETEDYYNSYCPVEAVRTLMIVYDKEDAVCGNLIEWTCSEAGESGAEFFSGGDLLISPGTRKPLKVSVFVDKFFNWLIRFEHELLNI